MKRKSSFKDFLFKLEPWKIVLTVVVFGLSIVYLVWKLLVGAASFVNWGLLGLYVGLLLLLTISRMTRFTEFGIRFSYFLLFMIVLTLGPITALVLRLLSVPLRMWLYMADIPLKSFFRAGERNILKQLGYSVISISVMGVFVQVISVGVVVSNLPFYYLILYGPWLGLLLMLRIIFPMKTPLSKYVIGTSVAFLFNWWLVKYVGMLIYGYLVGFI